MRLAAVLDLLAGCSTHPGSVAPTAVADVERRADVALPVGSTRGEVEGWLTERGIGHDFSDLPLLESQTVNMFPDEGDYSGFVHPARGRKRLPVLRPGEGRPAEAAGGALGR